MGQIVTLFESLPHIIDEVINIVIMVLILITAIKAVYNLCTCGLFALIMFLFMAGRSCSLEGPGMYKGTYQFKSVELNMSQFNQTLPNACSVNNSHHYIGMGDSGLELTFTNDSIIDHNQCNLTDYFKKSHFDHVLSSIITHLHLSVRGHSYYKAVSCDFNNGITIQYNLSINTPQKAVDNCRSFRGRVLDMFRTAFGGKHMRAGFGMTDANGKATWCSQTDYNYLIIQNRTWDNHCEYANPMGFARLLFAQEKTKFLTRRLMGTFTWTLSDSSGVESSSGYCLTRWMIIAADLKCFGNTAVAKCNLNHDEEFCDMLKLIDYNKAALTKFKKDVESALHLFKVTMNSLISDTLLMRNHLRDLMGIPYCNYSKFWYLEHYKTGETSLPKCWLVSNGSYLNETHFSDEIEQEANNMITEMLRKDYYKRQGSTPLALMDILMFSTSAYLISVFLHLLRIPTHRHVKGGTCPKPHRLNSKGICSCGAFKVPGVKVIWKRN
ncbi:Glycoprotein precursor [Lunk virus NKS-1]|uniref:Glycoprotein n=1 Tax=Lunk virus NKS-1 TaxID=1134579 RepID=K0IT71_9VIRU|nr:Glycoprotein precursor [Lunk virus NKS-1]BAM45328.1 Glycoprotein precursor [Lunk virus NKS-1]